jgi:hypothetical protein
VVSIMIDYSELRLKSISKTGCGPLVPSVFPLAYPTFPYAVYTSAVVSGAQQSQEATRNHFVASNDDIEYHDYLSSAISIDPPAAPQ